jgi:transcription antitermination factor NusG
MSCLAEPLLNHISTQNPALGNCRHWYVLYTYPRHEKAVREQLESRSIEAFLPTFISKNRWKDRCARVETPLFPGYVFIRISLSDRNRAFAVPGVIRMLSINGAPAPVDDSEIEAVKLCLEGGAALEPYPFIEVGDRVRVRSGLLEGMEGFVSRSKNERRFIVPISLINQSVSVEIDVELLEPLNLQNQNQYKVPSPHGKYSSLAPRHFAGMEHSN